MDINFKTIQKYLEERFHKVEQNGMYYYYDMTAKLAAIEENGIITMYYDAPKELVETPYGKLAVSIIDNFKIATREKTTLINAMNITHVTSNRNNISVEKECIIVPKWNYFLYEKRYSLGTVGTLEQDQNKKYHLTNEDFDIEFENEKFIEENTMENVKILVLKKLETSEENKNMKKINQDEIYDYYYNYMKVTKKGLENILYDIYERRFKTYDELETVVIRNTNKTEKQQKHQKQKIIKKLIKKLN